MSRPGTATATSTCLRVLRFFRRGADGHRQLVTTWVENRILTASLYPDGRCAPFALRYSLPWRHVITPRQQYAPNLTAAPHHADDCSEAARPGELGGRSARRPGTLAEFLTRTRGSGRRSR